MSQEGPVQCLSGCGQLVLPAWFQPSQLTIMPGPSLAGITCTVTRNRLWPGQPALTAHSLPSALPHADQLSLPL